MNFRDCESDAAVLESVCEEVRQYSNRIAGLCRAGLTEKAGADARELEQFVTQINEQRKRFQKVRTTEQFNIRGLHVGPNGETMSEWED